MKSGFFIGLISLFVAVAIADDRMAMPLGHAYLHDYITIMPLGDSITAGGGINPDGSRSSGYRLTLFTNLTSAGVNVQMLGSYNPSISWQDGFCTYLYDRNQNYNNGYPGYSSGDILGNLAGKKQPEFVTITNQGGYWLTREEKATHKPYYPDCILLMVGINDLGKHVPLGSPDKSGSLEGNVAGILSWINYNRPLTKVFVGTLLPTANAEMNLQVDKFNAWLAMYVTNFPNYDLVDTHGAFMSNGVFRRDCLLSDGTHPTIQGYTLLGDTWATSLRHWAVSYQKTKLKNSLSEH